MTRRYQVAIARRAVKALAALPKPEQQRVRAAIDLLAVDPRPPSCTKLTGEAGAYRVRIGAYRIVYEAVDERLVVQVVRIGHRRDVHRH
ncbi:MAG: type II toxin-antitoxin system RelE family toxin [Jiangellaceae bacterium]